MPDNLTEAQSMRAAYAHFTLDEWKLIASTLFAASYKEECSVNNRNAFRNILCKMPSAALHDMHTRHG